MLRINENNTLDVFLEEKKYNYLNSVFPSRAYAQELRFFDQSDFWYDKWLYSNRMLQSNRIAMLKKQNCISIIQKFLKYLYIVVSLMILAIKYIDSSVQYSEFTSAFYAIFSFSTLIGSKMPNDITKLFKNRIQWKYTSEFRNLPNTTTTGTPSNHLDNINCTDSLHIIFDNVWFKYPNQDFYTLENVSFSFTTNQKILIVGSNGAGKSTLIKLMLGLYTPTKGAIYVNNINLIDIDPTERRHCFSVIFQDFIKYNLTIRENLAFDNEINDFNMAELLGLDTVLNKTKLGLEQPLGKLESNGIDLSGGEWQRVAIFRAFHNSALCTILDEPTSSLDPKMDLEITKKLFDKQFEKGFILVTHRLGICRLADRILVIDNKTIVGDGNHDNLYNVCDCYREMYRIQEDWYK